MASFFTISSSSSALLSRTSPLHFKGLNSRLSSILRVNCLSEPGKDAETKPETTSDAPGISSNNWCAAIGGLGFVETGYLSFLKLTDSNAFCPIGGGSCGDILNSEYALVFGVPLPLVGMISYGLVATLSLQLPKNDLPFGLSKNSGRLILLGTTASMATASAFFLYILATKFSGASCSYCLVSALLSFSLFFATLKDFTPQELQKTVGLQLCVASLVVAALSTSYNTTPSFATSVSEPELEFFKTEVNTESSPFAISLAKHLRSVGAKMYGAFWCSHCLEQKEMFGREAAKILDYVECFPNGYMKGIKIEKACSDVKVEGFPMWIINDTVLSGEQELLELARVSGFESDVSSQS